jgi:quinol-cytochrome oxidoreductase complex cytochrome b subunit
VTTPTRSGDETATQGSRFRPQNGGLWALLAVGGVLVAVLVVSGVWLWWGYRPTPERGWTEPLLSGAAQTANRVRIVHRTASMLLVNLAVVSALVTLGLRSTRRRWPAAMAGVGLVVVAAYTGYLLPWEQLSLSAVTVGNDLSGARAAFDGGVRFVLLSGAEVGRGTYRSWAIVHAVVVPLAAIAVGAGALRRWRRPRRGPG